MPGSNAGGYHFQQNLQVEPAVVIMAVRFKDGTIRCFQGRANDVYHGPVPPGEDDPGPISVIAAELDTDPLSWRRATGAKFHSKIEWAPGSMTMRHQPGVERWDWSGQEDAEIEQGPKEIES